MAEDYKAALARIKEAMEEGTIPVLVVVFLRPCNTSYHPERVVDIHGTELGRVATNLTERQIGDLLAIAAKNLDRMRKE